MGSVLGNPLCQCLQAFSLGLVCSVGKNCKMAGLQGKGLTARTILVVSVFVMHLFT